MSRRTGRENAFKLIYEFCVSGDKNDFTLDLLTKNESEEDAAFCRELVNGVAEHYDFLCGIVGRYAKGYALERVFKVDLAAICLAAYELLFTPVPPKVAVNEALELVKVYSTDDSATFVNGILASVIANLEELKEEHKNECENN